MNVSMVSVSRRAGAPHAGHVDVHELRNILQRGPPRAGDLDAVGENHGELILGHRDHAASRAVDRRWPARRRRRPPLRERAIGQA